MIRAFTRRGKDGLKVASFNGLGDGKSIMK